MEITVRELCMLQIQYWRERQPYHGGYHDYEDEVWRSMGDATFVEKFSVFMMRQGQQR